MNLKITRANYSARTMTELLNTIDEVCYLYDINNVSYEYEMFIRETGYIAKFKLYG